MGAVYVEGMIEGADIVERDKLRVGHVSDIASLQLQTSCGSAEEISARVFVNACGPWVCITHISHPSAVIYDMSASELKDSIIVDDNILVFVSRLVSWWTHLHHIRSTPCARSR